MWNVKTREPLGTPLTGHQGPVRSVTFNHDGSLILSSSDDDTLRLWPTAAKPDDLCEKLSSNVSRKQWDEWVAVSASIDYEVVCDHWPVPPDSLTPYVG